MTSCIGNSGQDNQGEQSSTHEEVSIQGTQENFNGIIHEESLATDSILASPMIVVDKNEDTPSIQATTTENNDF